MKPLARIPFVLVAILTLVALPASTRAATPGGMAHRDVLVLRAGSIALGSLIALPAGNGPSRRLPLGLFDRRAHTLYVATPQAGSRRSLVQAIDPSSGRILRSLTVAGDFSTTSGDYAAAALSFDSRWLALRDGLSGTTATTALVIDTIVMRVIATIHLAGHFGTESAQHAGDERT